MRLGPTDSCSAGTLNGWKTCRRSSSASASSEGVVVMGLLGLRSIARYANLDKSGARCRIRPGAVPMSTALSLELTDRSLLREELLIDGAWVGGAAGARDVVTDPATGQLVGEVARGTRADARRAIEAADA